MLAFQRSCSQVKGGRVPDAWHFGKRGGLTTEERGARSSGIIEESICSKQAGPPASCRSPEPSKSAARRFAFTCQHRFKPRDCVGLWLSRLVNELLNVPTAEARLP